MITLDAAMLWLRGQAQRLAEFARMMTQPERRLSGMLLALLVVAPSAVLLAGWTAAWGAFTVALVAATLLAPVLADAVLARSHMDRLDVHLQEARQAAMLANASKATGAPRVAEVPCSHGVVQRFIYGPDGWAPAGPAPDTRPEEVRTP